MRLWVCFLLLKLSFWSILSRKLDWNKTIICKCSMAIDNPIFRLPPFFFVFEKFMNCLQKLVLGKIFELLFSQLKREEMWFDYTKNISALQFSCDKQKSEKLLKGIYKRSNEVIHSGWIFSSITNNFLQNIFIVFLIKFCIWSIWLVKTAVIIIQTDIHLIRSIRRTKYSLWQGNINFESGEHTCASREHISKHKCQHFFPPKFR